MEEIRNPAPAPAETGGTGGFVHRVAFTTCLTFTLVTFFYLIFNVLVIRSHDTATHDEHFIFMLGKVFCIFLFSLCMGFANRIPERKKGKRIVLRLARFGAAAVSFAITMILLFYTIFDPETLNPRGAMANFALFLFFYFVTLGVTALGRRLFGKKEKKDYKSILD
ncbi:MAG: hypothetical protein J6Z79_03600 [Clostridia bacterium]|nr:hypothetical protein [Clostridia bacterium]